MNAKILNQLFIVVALIKAVFSFCNNGLTYQLFFNLWVVLFLFFSYIYIYKIFSFKDKNRMQWIILLISVFSFLVSMITKHFSHSFIISLPISYLLLYGEFLKDNKNNKK